MQLAGFDYQVLVNAELSGREVMVLMELAATHYDMKCRQAGACGGFLYDIANQWIIEDSQPIDPDELAQAEDLDRTVCVTINTHQIGILGKIGEGEPTYPQGLGLTGQFHRLLQACNTRYSALTFES